MSNNLAQRIKIPEVFRPLFRPGARYYGAWGGRGSGKSHAFATRLVLECVHQQVRAVCLREVQNSIKDSVKQLIEDKIGEYGLLGDFDINDQEIRGPNDSLIIFRGLKSHNAASIKSLEGFNRAWVEEAQTVSQKSLDLLIPTLRADGSELWFSWNPDQPTDPIDKLLRNTSNDNAVVVRANFSDNPFFPEALREDMERDKRSDPAKYAHVWLGEYQTLADMQFISWDDVNSAQQRQFKRGGKPVLFGIDVARFGDDRSVLAIREGDVLTDLMKWERLDTQQLAGYITEVANSRKPQALFVDGVGVGGGVVDRLRVLGLNVIEVNGGAKAAQDNRYFNKRAEMWGRMREWLRDRGVIHQTEIDLAAELTGPMYKFDPSNRIMLEKKDEMKKRGLRSPDLADALSLTFAEHVAAPHQSMQSFEPMFVAPDDNILDSW
ncbi:PBSX family phage terminase large subunit [Brucella tritici]|uniref:PBSX family phage terminase large subunit n=1 Tax=Brucella tritici TaxID=94626 RepID=UPI00249501F3|nr:PBSX family phage terminase large subunit [Brucella tritici]